MTNDVLVLNQSPSVGKVNFVGECGLLWRVMCGSGKGAGLDSFGHMSNTLTVIINILCI